MDAIILKPNLEIKVEKKKKWILEKHGVKVNSHLLEKRYKSLRNAPVNIA